MDYTMTRLLLALACLFLTSCNQPYKSEGEKLAHKYCAACHAFPEPELLDKQTWASGVLPEMAPRLGIGRESLFDEGNRNRYMMVLTKTVSKEDWEKIVGYYRDHAPAALPYQSLPAQPQIDPPFFKTGPLVPGMKSSGIITLLKADPIHERIFVGEAGSNTLRVFDWNRRLLSSLTLGSPPTDLIVDKDHVLVLEAGILDPNDQPKGTLVQYDFTGADSLRFRRVLIDSLLRPVFVQQFDFDHDGRKEFVICEFGNNRGRLALYKEDGTRYRREVIDSSPGAIR